jgi:hypothetical protein
MKRVVRPVTVVKIEGCRFSLDSRRHRRWRLPICQGGVYLAVACKESESRSSLRPQ